MPFPSAGDTAPDLTLAERDGRPVRLASLWAAQPVAMFFLRHFG